MRYTVQTYAPQRVRGRRRRGSRTADVLLMMVMIGLSLMALSAGAWALVSWRAEAAPTVENGAAELVGGPAAEMKSDGVLAPNTDEVPSMNPPVSTQDQTTPILSGTYDYSKPVPSSNLVDLTYFDDAVFIGDSRTEGLFLNTSLSNATSFAHMGLMVDTVFTRPLFNVNGEKVPVIDAMKKAEFAKVYIMLGINETGWAYSSIFIQKYGAIIDAIREINPDALIYVQSIMPVSQKVSSTHSYVKNPKITEYNQLLLQLAEEKQVYYIDTASAVAGEDGSLPDDAAPDGIHLVRSYCQRWLDYLMAHTVV